MSGKSLSFRKKSDEKITHPIFLFPIVLFASFCDGVVEVVGFFFFVVVASHLLVAVVIELYSCSFVGIVVFKLLES